MLWVNVILVSLTPLPESAWGVEGLLGVVYAVAAAAAPEYQLWRCSSPELGKNAKESTRGLLGC